MDINLRDIYLDVEDYITLMNIYKTTHNILTKYGVKYWITDGSLMGAYRHNGIIPWDEDIDIAITLDEKKKVQSIPSSEWGKNGLHLQHTEMGWKIYRLDGKNIKHP